MCRPETDALRFLVLGMLAGVLLTGCQPVLVASTPTPSAVLPLAIVDQVDPPALAWLNGRIFAFFIGTDTDSTRNSANVHHDVRVIDQDGMLSPVVVLPLPPRHPFDQRALPGLDGVHLLWLDADPATPDRTRLYGAFITPDLAVQRGPTPLTPDSDPASRPVTAYTTAPRPDGSVSVAWVDDAAILWEAVVDAAGRPGAPRQVAINARLPALAWPSPGETSPTDAPAHLFWQSTRTGAWMYARITTAGISPPIMLANGVFLHPADRMIAVDAHIDGQNGDAVLIMTVVRANGMAESSAIAGRLAAGSWPPPQPMLTESSQPIRHAAILRGSAALRAIGHVDGAWLELAFDDGSWRGVRRWTDEPLPARPPAFVMEDGNRALGWASASTTPATLYVQTGDAVAP